jgi:hypothetical protein
MSENNNSVPDKKEELNNKENTVDTSLTNKKNVTSFFAELISNIFQLSIVIWIGTMMLYSCRAASANSYPICRDYYPYKDESFSHSDFTDEPFVKTVKSVIFNNGAPDNCTPIEMKGGAKEEDLALGISLANSSSSASNDHDETINTKTTTQYKLQKNVLAPINIIKYADKTDPENPKEETYVSFIRFNLEKIFSNDNGNPERFDNFLMMDSYWRKGAVSSKNYERYIAKFFQKVISFNFNIISKIYKTINSTFSESVIVFLMPFLLIFIIPFVIILSILRAIWTVFEQWKMFGKNKLDDKNEQLGVMGVFCALLATFIAFWIVLCLCGPICTFIAIAAFMRTLWVPTTILEYNDRGQLCEKPYSLFKFNILDLFNVTSVFTTGQKREKTRSLFMDVLKNKSQVIMAILSYHVVQNSFKYFGNYNGFVAFMICLIVYVFSKPFNMYGQYIPSQDEMNAADANAVGDDAKQKSAIFNIDISRLSNLTESSPFDCPEKSN